MLRSFVLGIAILVTAIGAVLCFVGVIVPGLQTVIIGGIVVVGTLFERWRYQNKQASAAGAWQRTGERFVDPETGKNVEVLYDPTSGERRYEPLTDRYDKPD